MAKQAKSQKAREKRAKIMVAVLGVLFLGVAAIMVPKTLAKLNQKPPPLAGNVLPPNGNPVPAPGQAPLAAPTLAGAVPAVATDPASTAAAAATAGSPPAPAAGQLISFGRFASKDPFHQQISTKPGATPPDGSGVPGTGAGAGSDAGAGAGAGSGGDTGGTSSPTPPSPIPPGGTAGSSPSSPATSASISVNGIAEIVSPGKDFPAATPVFHLVSLGPSWAKIAIAGGSYASGTSTVTLKKGSTLTLENTADHTRYSLKLLALNPTAVAGAAPAGTATTPTPVTP